ncbi:hypothetical protein RZS08_18500, partial [Arthrospira platensis SPKY1]|nr:hypothetical protein [Arthrospira platensis SPKY1]
FARIGVYDYFPDYPWVIQNHHPILFSIALFATGIALFGLTAIFSDRMVELDRRLRHTSSELAKTQLELKKENDNLLRVYDELRKLAEHNSHELRRPVARIQAVINVYDDLMDQELDPFEMTQIELKSSIRDC